MGQISGAGVEKSTLCGQREEKVCEIAYTLVMKKKDVLHLFPHRKTPVGWLNRGSAGQY